MIGTYSSHGGVSRWVCPGIVAIEDQAGTYRIVRKAVHQLLDPTAKQTVVAKAGNIAISCLILANVVAAILDSMPSVNERFGIALNYFETFSVAAFTLEYLLRIWTCVELTPFRRPILGRLRWATSPMGLIDLAVILPAYLPNVTMDLRFVRIVRLIRMLRVLKFARYSKTLRTFAVVFEAKRPELGLVLLFLGVLIVLSSSFMYLAEHPAQPEQFSSIPAAMWWSVMTLTTVGYGDIYPITPIGKLLGAVIALVGIGFFALPAGVLAAAFAEELSSQRNPKRCPHCGKDLK